MSEKPRLCFAGCEFFRCGQRQLFYRGGASWCRYADDQCDPKTCKYAQCARDRLLLDGVCGLTVRPKTVEMRLEEVAKPIKVPSKLAQKIKEKELY